MADYFPTTRASRAPSVSSAGTASTTGAYNFLPRYTPKPEPAYVSASAAADHVTHRHHDEMYDLMSPAASPTNDGALFSDSALALLNSFLDSLLYNFLAKSRGTKLSQLRPAIVEVLKSKLGREALASADEELEGLVEDGDDEDVEEGHAHTNGIKDERRASVTSTADWHLESVFKRMRLRVMKFIRLGDFDDDDEEKFLEEDDESGVFVHDSNALSSSSPVYLASVLEYLAEQSLSIAGDAAHNRSRSRARRTISENSPVDNFDQERVIVEDIDVEKIALNSALGRLWRTWRKNYRNSTSPASPVMSYSRRSSVASPTRSADDMIRRQGMRQNSTSGMIKEESETPQDDIPDCNPTETDIAANIPIPTTERDVDEIEIPGLAAVIYDEGEERLEDEMAVKPQLKRLRSSSFLVPGRFVPDAEEDVVSEIRSRPAFKRQRSNSVPPLTTMPWDWLPGYVRRALARYANMSEEERLAYAASIPLPHDKYIDGEELALDAASIPLPEDEAERVKEVAAAETEKNVSLDSIDEEREPGVMITDESLPTSSSTVPKDVGGPMDASKVGKIAGAAGLAAAGATAGGAMAKSSHGKSEPEATERRPSARDSLSIQSKEIFEPDESDTARPSMEAAPQISRESSPDTIVHVQSDKQKAVTSQDQKSAAEKSGLSVLKNNASLADKDKSLISAYSPENFVATDDASAIVTQQASRSQSPANSSNNRFADSTTDVEQNGVREAAVSGVAPLELKKATSGVDSKLTSPNHIASQAVASEARKSSPKHSRSSSPTSEKLAHTTIGETTVVPAQQEQKEATDPAVVQQPKQAPHQEGPPKPLTATSGHPSNPYAMLYEDIEPDAIGVAKTSNVPIHSTTPSLSAESRPWTPNRGASTTILPSQAGTLEQRNRNIPSPLRVGRQDQDVQASQQPRDASKSAASKTDDYDLDKPINPERFQNWNRPKESPTIPKFYNQLVSTPTSSEGPRPVNGSPAQHSPKGSQGSQKSQNKRVSEEIKEREFDALLDRKETVKYTLTPEEIRDIHPYSQKGSLDRKPPTPIDTTRKTALPAALSPTLFRRNTPQQTPQVPQVPPSPKRPLKISDIRKSISALSPEPAEPKMRRSGLMARNARVQGGETKDFVDFIRSCPPTSEEQTQPPVLSHRLSANSSLHGTQNSQRESLKKNLVPREPDLRTGTSDELIDFIRRGPPPIAPGTSNGDREPRIPRTVAPFRSTMDSDDLGNLVNGSSPHNSVLSRPSVTDSYTSSAPLMNTNKPLPSQSKGSALAAPQPQVTRKTRRNKDPYAIDTDDEEEEPRTETLAEFLMATNPPAASRQNGASNGGASSSRNEPLNFRAPVSAGSRSRKPATESQAQKGAVSQPKEPSPAANSVAGRTSNTGLGSSSFSKKKLEARPAGATRGFGGLGYYYSTHDLADYLRTSGPKGVGLNGNPMNGGPVSAVGSHSNRMSDSLASMNGRMSSSEDAVKKSNSMRKRLWGRA